MARNSEPIWVGEMITKSKSWSGYTKEEMTEIMMKNPQSHYIDDKDGLPHCRRCGGVRVCNIKGVLPDGTKYDCWFPNACECRLNDNWQPQKRVQNQQAEAEEKPKEKTLLERAKEKPSELPEWLRGY